MSRTAHTRPRKRSVRIHSMPSGNRVHVRYAPTLKSGLEGFFKDFLKPHGYTNKKIVGNCMIVRKDDAEYEFRAFEEVNEK